MTVVQWQDTPGAWHDVEGWRGSLDEVTGDVGRKVWWLPEALFGQGPFRWVVYTESGRVLAESEAFDLPARKGEIVIRSLSLDL